MGNGSSSGKDCRNPIEISFPIQQPQWPPDSQREKTNDKIKVKYPTEIMGRKCYGLTDTRTQNIDTKSIKPEVNPGELWVDEAFPFKVAMAGHLDENVKWKRPGDIAHDPKLFIEGVERFDVGQGRAGTCYFLAVLSALADDIKTITQVIVEDYCIGTPEYRGVFHCRFWRLGEWHDVYVDDFLPCDVDGSLWGAQSTTNPNEMWVALTEKALAKFFGSYQNAEGGDPADAFTALTGGIAEEIEHSTSHYDLYKRVQNALESKGFVIGSTKDKNRRKQGIVGLHAYSFSKVTEINGKHLFLLRNPWGQKEDERTRPWADGAPVEVAAEFEDKGDGEFWISLEKYLKYFDTTTVCYFRPDFDEDGIQDNLDKTSIALGEWYQSTAAGPGVPQQFNNPKFWIDIKEDQGSIPVVLQLSQRKLSTSKIKRKDVLPYIRLEVYKIEQTFEKPKLAVLLSNKTNMTTYLSSRTVIYRYTLGAGQYMLVPHTYGAGMHNDFMVRVISTQILEIKSFEEKPEVFLLSLDTDIDPSQNMACCVLGEWREGTAAGSDIPQKFNNPMFRFTIEPTLLETAESIPVVLQIIQRCVAHRDLLPIRLDLYKIESEIKEPKASVLLKEMTKNTTYMVGKSVTYRYVCRPGEYILLPHTMDENMHGDFIICTLWTKPIEIRKYEEDSAIFIQSCDMANHLKLASLDELHMEHHFGQWSDCNAGGQVENYETHDRNPQYALQVSGKEKVKVAINLKQDNCLEIEAIGISVYKVKDSKKIPLSIDYLTEQHKKLKLKPLLGDLFIKAYEVNPVFKLSPGLYSVIIFTDKPNVKRGYVLSFGFRAGAEVKVTGHNIFN